MQEHEYDYGEAPPPGASDKKYDDLATRRFKAISDRVKAKTHEHINENASKN